MNSQPVVPGGPPPWWKRTAVRVWTAVTSVAVVAGLALTLLSLENEMRARSDSQVVIDEPAKGSDDAVPPCVLVRGKGTPGEGKVFVVAVVPPPGMRAQLRIRFARVVTDGQAWSVIAGVAPAVAGAEGKTFTIRVFEMDAGWVQHLEAIAGTSWWTAPAMPPGYETPLEAVEVERGTGKSSC